MGLYIYIYNSYIIPYLKTPKNPKGFVFLNFAFPEKTAGSMFFSEIFSHCGCKLKLEERLGDLSQIRWDLAAK